LTVTANNTRVRGDVFSNTGISSIGGGAGAESTDNPAAFFYQGTGIIYRKVTSSTGAGFQYENASTDDMTADATRTFMCKVNCTDFGGLQATNGMRVRIGSGSGAYHDYVVAGSSAKIPALQEYPAKGGFILVPIDPNIVAYRNSTSGSPALASGDYYALVGAFASASAKAENIGLDALDLGTGLTLDGTGVALVDFVNYDEGTSTNRFGYATVLADGVYQAFGTWTMASATATTITDTTRVGVIFADGLFAAGWSGLAFDLQNASTAISISNKDWKSLGSTAVEDTRAIVNVTGTSGSLTLDYSVFTNLASITFTSGVTFDNNTVLTSEVITQSGATITNNTFSGSVNVTTEALITVDDLSLVTDNYFEGDGTGYAINLGTISSSTTLTWDNTFNTSNFAAVDGSTGNEVIKVNYTDTGSALVINVATGADAPTAHNTGAGTVTIQVGYTLTLTDVPSGARVTIVNSSTRNILQDSISTGVDITYPHAGGETVDILIIDDLIDPNLSDIHDLTLPTTDSSIKIQTFVDGNFENP